MIITPAELIEFGGDSDEIRDAFLDIRSTEKTDVNVKIRTTGPKFYSVKPNGVTLAPGESETFTISLHPGRYKLNGHKFSVTASSNDENGNEVSQIFKFKSRIHDVLPVLNSGDYTLHTKMEKSPQVARINIWYSIVICTLCIIIGVFIGPTVKDLAKFF